MTGVDAADALKAQYLADFSALEGTGAVAGPAWLQALRRSARDRFAEVGFPTVRDEAWRYTSVAPLVEGGFRPVVVPGHDGGAALVAGGLIGPAAWPRLVFVDGRYAPVLSSPGPRPQPTGLRVAAFAEALAEDSALLQEHLGRHASWARDGFTALNTAFTRDGALIALPAGLRLAPPVYLAFIATAGVLVQPRVLIVAAPGSEATIVQHYLGAGDHASLTNAVTEIVLGEGAVVQHHVLQEEGQRALHVGTVQVDQDRASTFRSSVAVIGGRLVRNNLGVLLRGERASAQLDGLYALDGTQHVDNHVTVDHAAPRCTSQQLYKGLLAGRSRAVFNGRILVRRDAQKTDATQTNKSLLLTEGPEVYSKPQLEIFADDVRCTHGAAEGQIAEDALFYLESRGLREPSARALLAYGFAREVIERIPLEVIRVRLDGLLQARLQPVQFEETTR